MRSTIHHTQHPSWRKIYIPQYLRQYRQQFDFVHQGPFFCARCQFPRYQRFDFEMIGTGLLDHRPHEGAHQQMMSKGRRGWQAGDTTCSLICMRSSCFADELSEIVGFLVLSDFLLSRGSPTCRWSNHDPKIFSC